jgi:hypothetical protein
MEVYGKKTLDPAEEKINEKLRADIARQQATLEYLAAMAGIELPGDDENGGEGGAEIE